MIDGMQFPLGIGIDVHGGDQSGSDGQLLFVFVDTGEVGTDERFVTGRLLGASRLDIRIYSLKRSRPNLSMLSHTSISENRVVIHGVPDAQ